MVIQNKILHCTLKSQFEGTCKMISLGASDANEVSVLYTYLLSGRAGWVDIWLEVCVSWPRAKYVPVQLDLTQSIRILSYDHCVWIFLTEQTSINQYAFLAVPYGELFFHMVFQQNCTRGHSGHMINIYVLFFHHYCVNYLAFIFMSWQRPIF